MTLQRKMGIRPNKKTNSGRNGHVVRLPYGHSTKDLPGNLSFTLNKEEPCGVDQMAQENFKSFNHIKQ